MLNSPGFPDLLRLIDDRSTAFRAAIASAPTLDVQVPSCPDWQLADLAQHLGGVQRRWAANVAVGPADGPAMSRDDPRLTAPADREALLAWLADGTEQLLASLREAGPDRGCWTWWDRSISPETSGAVARHQVQEAAVHTYDVQLTLGAPKPLPAEVAVDGAEEFLSTSCAGSYRWQYEPAVVDYLATEGRAWRLTLAADGARLTSRDLPSGASTTDDGVEAPDASAQGTAGDIVLFLYGRLSMDDLTLAGDRRIFDQLIEWDPDA